MWHALSDWTAPFKFWKSGFPGMRFLKYKSLMKFRCHVCHFYAWQDSTMFQTFWGANQYQKPLPWTLLSGWTRQPTLFTFSQKNGFGLHRTHKKSWLKVFRFEGFKQNGISAIWWSGWWNGINKKMGNYGEKLFEKVFEEVQKQKSISVWNLWIFKLFPSLKFKEVKLVWETHSKVLNLI